MNRYWSVQARALLAIAGVVALTACEDKRVKAIDTGITKDSLMSVLATGPSRNADSLPAIYRREQYLIGGKLYDVLYFHGDTARLTPQTKDTIQWKDLTPIVTIQNKVVGKGWPVWDSIATANHIPLKDRSEKAKKDTTKKK